MTDGRRQHLLEELRRLNEQSDKVCAKCRLLLNYAPAHNHTRLHSSPLSQHYQWPAPTLSKIFSLWVCVVFHLWTQSS
jgi:hypothetical protein